MIDLTKVSGLPMEVTDDFQLNLKPGVVESGQKFVRKLSEMEPVLFDRKAKPEQEELYHVYRGISLESDKTLTAVNHIQYDVTIIPPIMLGDEYNKTLGHYHQNIEGSTVAHPEIYEVLNGKALFLLQKMDPEMKNVITILAFEAGAGDKVIYPPNYGHIIVNIGAEVLVTANWISTDYKPLYEPIKEKEGMAIYVIRGKDGQPTFVKNENYENQPLMRKLTMNDKVRTDFGFDAQEPMYTAAIRNPKLLEFLNNPIKYAVQFSSLSS
ncbi:MAG: hypothetical protein A3I07_02875 [Candidatus Doudnabacteria bacterium RIFCSPLOWO2_02_FULL_42_9]|uniref:glucose-6-phosphate isomerase n=1 Tax=Candidatus Doudnabacteria bacterium RIFCSPHIGHO2_01_FULL_41_86 TaxID=1817821 RepID=A0A1F5N7R7_9BACT|nr:MAG: hypothetical protein A2717_03315 [Candidatus Doudnabacteria bacterium RIFCSPHIGHO2_01_FULL_41_86]OGE75678.1 MAG: hypothetical protein A3K07_00375 [Candidatus Doudnabacteria bacterium RIFCSPHIGHO2_01_43_10]OGE85674.1 MAG: hypothetical protein A3E28_02645 [Candidatus Doudnabacteria bacterium RIFCSPHIGHO2_12_FULL_42_22]OGE87169.1 MAG: hypothetical protein A3C49_00275 [Candidatus Doudnabacteria bacterium RIFCSPHIGHO2_02_FULL_42_25]OGE92007.1 MAG: hypothetical protein A2895_00150 [Candidatus